MIKTNCDIKKLTQVAGLFLKLNKGKMDYRKLMALMYLADRKMLELYDETITGDTYYMVNQ